MSQNININNLKNMIGCQAAKACSIVLPLIDKLEAIALLQYCPPPSVQARSQLSEKELEITSKAALIRKNNWFSYIEILLELSAKADFVTEGILDAVNYHQGHTKERIWLNKEQIVAEELVRISNADKLKHPVALCSKVSAKENNQLHIPLLDFHVEKTAMAFEMVKHITRTLFGSDFMVLATNRSFHSIGLTLKYDEEFRQLLARSILFAPIVDNAYVAHQLIEGEAVLRISKNGPNIPAPVVIAVSCGEGHLSISSLKNL
jgi:hypothetical protein